SSSFASCSSLCAALSFLIRNASLIWSSSYSSTVLAFLYQRSKALQYWSRDSFAARSIAFFTNSPGGRGKDNSRSRSDAKTKSLMPASQAFWERSRCPPKALVSQSQASETLLVHSGDRMNDNSKDDPLPFVQLAAVTRNVMEFLRNQRVIGDVSEVKN